MVHAPEQNLTSMNCWRQVCILEDFATTLPHQYLTLHQVSFERANHLSHAAPRRKNLILQIHNNTLY